jgi:diamine N-acetyltransferase
VFAGTGVKKRKASKAKGVTLRNVTADNWRAVVNLELEERQKGLLAPNVYSIAESKFSRAARPRAIYAGKRLVGFIMYERISDEPGAVLIYRFMIDRRHQGEGYGRAALEKAIREIARMPRVTRVRICYAARNPVAGNFYGSLGFVETGQNRWGEISAERKV